MGLRSELDNCLPFKALRREAPYKKDIWESGAVYIITERMIV